MATYYHPLLEKPQEFHNIKVAGLKDLAAMKLFTLLDRLRKRDIYDLYFLAQKFDLTDMLLFFEYRFGGVKISKPVILKALSDLSHVPEDEEVNLIDSDVTWDKVKNFWRREVEKYAKDKIGKV